MTGTLSASGGDGGDGVPATDHHGGGGGGGGRVKLLYLDGMQDTASVRISGGRAGLGWATGIVGQDGSVHRGTTPETMTTIQFSASDPPLY
jgi:hypothetical protein